MLQQTRERERENDVFMNERGGTERKRRDKDKEWRRKRSERKRKKVGLLILIGSFPGTDKFECRSADINVFWCQPFSPVSWSLW